MGYGNDDQEPDWTITGEFQLTARSGKAFLIKTGDTEDGQIQEVWFPTSQAEMTPKHPIKRGDRVEVTFRPWLGREKGLVDQG